MSANIQVGDIGTIFEVTVKDEAGVAVNLSSATTKEILLQKPDKTVLTKTASFKTTGTDGIITYTLSSGDINQNGIWSIQAHVILPSGEWHSSVEAFEVLGNI